MVINLVSLVDCDEAYNCSHYITHSYTFTLAIIGLRLPGYSLCRRCLAHPITLDAPAGRVTPNGRGSPKIYLKCDLDSPDQSFKVALILSSCKSWFRHFYLPASRISYAPISVFQIHYFQRTDCGGRGNPAPTLTVSAYGAFGTIRGLFIFVKVGARSPRPHLVGVFSDSLCRGDPPWSPPPRGGAAGGRSNYLSINRPVVVSRFTRSQR